MKVLHISASSSESGAGIASLKIHLALLARGVDSKILFFVGKPDKSQEIYVFADTIFKKVIRFLVTKLDSLPKLLYLKRNKKIFFSPGLVGSTIKNNKLVQWADIIHLNWINHGFVNVTTVNDINKPVVFTMHDMWAFTGGCHYSFDCKGYLESCGQCPVLASSSTYDLSYIGWKNKKKAYVFPPIKFVAISTWMREAAQASSLLRGKQMAVIPSGIVTSIFFPKDRTTVKKELGIESSKKIILLGAENIYNPSKGVKYAVDALKKLQNPDQYLLITFGNGELTKQDVNMEVINIGFINDAVKLSKVYSVSNLFLAPSVAEAFGMTLAEAQCCGIPVVAFDVMGPKDIIEHKKTGYLSPTIDSDGLLQGINYCMTNEFDAVSISSRASKLFSIKNCADSYLNLYRELMKCDNLLNGN